jgi:hypothetical protein
MITPQLRARLESASFEIRDLSSVPGSLDDAKQTCMISKNLSAAWIVLDGYHFDGSYQQRLRT